MYVDYYQNPLMEKKGQKEASDYYSEHRRRPQAKTLKDGVVLGDKFAYGQKWVQLNKKNLTNDMPSRLRMLLLQVHTARKTIECRKKSMAYSSATDRCLKVPQSKEPRKAKVAKPKSVKAKKQPRTSPQPKAKTPTKSPSESVHEHSLVDVVVMVPLYLEKNGDLDYYPEYEDGYLQGSYVDKSALFKATKLQELAKMAKLTKRKYIHENIDEASFMDMKGNAILQRHPFTGKIILSRIGSPWTAEWESDTKDPKEGVKQFRKFVRGLKPFELEWLMVAGDLFLSMDERTRMLVTKQLPGVPGEGVGIALERKPVTFEE